MAVLIRRRSNIFNPGLTIAALPIPQIVYDNGFTADSETFYKTLSEWHGLRSSGQRDGGCRSRAAAIISARVSIGPSLRVWSPFVINLQEPIRPGAESPRGIGFDVFQSETICNGLATPMTSVSRSLGRLREVSFNAMLSRNLVFDGFRRFARPRPASKYGRDGSERKNPLFELCAMFCRRL